MENAVEALKIAGAVLLFVMALSLSISSLSQANQAVSNIATMYDKEAQYQYVKPSNSLTRTVSAETIVTTMYKAYDENIRIVFQDKNGKPLPIYYKTNQYGSRVAEDGTPVTDVSKAVIVNYIDLSEEGFATLQDAIEHLDMILAGKNKWKKQAQSQEDSEKKQNMLDMLEKTKYGNQFYESYTEGFYNFLTNSKFTEGLGEYYQGETEGEETSSSSSTKIKKRVIIYTKQ